MKNLPFKPGVDFLPEIHDYPPEVRITRPRGGYDRIAVVRANEVHAVIIRADGSIEDLGISHNLRTTVGLDWEAAILGGKLGFGVSGTIATASSATSLTGTSSPFTSTDFYKGQIVVAEESTNAPVWGNIGTNSTSVLTVDAWRTGDDTAGTTPGSTANFLILPGSGAARYIGLTTDSGAASAGSTTLTSEITTNGLQRAKATYAHTPAASTYTQSNTFTASGSFTAVHRGGMFTASTTTAGGIIVFETVLNADATLASSDQLALTWTVNI